jgi:CubicO group peptidase (beta-lactamase class C family)
LTLAYVSGNEYLIFAVRNTYLKGRSGPSPLEYNIFKNRTIATGKARPWPKSSDYNSTLLPDTAIKNLEELRTLAFVVIRNDSMVFEKYWEGHGPEEISNSFSMAKTIVSILTGIALQEGKIKSLEEPVGNYIPEYKNGMGGKLKIRHLLNMSSGINFDEDYVSPFAYPAKAYYGEELEQLSKSYSVTEEPGKTFRYLSGNTELLAMVLQKATGMNISRYASEKLWKPIGATQNALWNLDHEGGIEKAYCCFIAAAGDFARLGNLYLHDGSWEGKQIVTPSFVKESITPAPLLDDQTNERIDRYGYSWWLTKYKQEPVFYARGILGQYIMVIPSKKIVAVRMGHKRRKEKLNDHPIDLFNYLEIAEHLALKR